MKHIIVLIFLILTMLSFETSVGQDIYGRGNIIYPSGTVEVSSAYVNEVPGQKYGDIQRAITYLSTVITDGRRQSYNIIVKPGVYSKFVMINGVHIYAEPGVIVKDSCINSIDQGAIEFAMNTPYVNDGSSKPGRNNTADNFGILGYMEVYQLGINKYGHALYFKNGFRSTPDSADALHPIFTPYLQFHIISSTASATIFSQDTVRGMVRLESRNGIFRHGNGNTDTTIGIAAIDLNNTTNLSYKALFKLIIRNTPCITHFNYPTGQVTPKTGTMQVIHVGDYTSIEIHGALIYNNRTNTGTFNCLKIDANAGSGLSVNGARLIAFYNCSFKNDKTSSVAILLYNSSTLFSNCAISTAGSAASIDGSGAEITIIGKLLVKVDKTVGITVQESGEIEVNALLNIYTN